jgi:hypothetical protein
MVTKTASPERIAKDLAKRNNAEPRPSYKHDVVAPLKLEQFVSLVFLFFDKEGGRSDAESVSLSGEQGRQGMGAQAGEAVFEHEREHRTEMAHGTVALGQTQGCGQPRLGLLECRGRR